MGNIPQIATTAFHIASGPTHCGYTKSGSTTGGMGPIVNYLDFEQITNCSG